MDGFEDTLILVFSDHGEEFLEHGGWWHGDTMYEEAIRVPLVMRLPGDEAAGTVIEDLVGLVDVAPTLVRMGGGAIPSTYQGEDLFAARDAPLFGEEQHVGNDIQSLVYRRDDGGIWKVITCNEENPRGLPPRSLFDLSSDPGEKENLADVNRPELELALEMLARAMKEAARGAVEKKSVEIDEASRRRLQELGYIQDEE
jgi:arylsulfatase A-like enzyme